MTIILTENEVCSLATQCPYNSTDSCWGARANRNSVFTCEYVKNGKIIKDQPMRMPQDKTGKMKVIME